MFSTAATIANFGDKIKHEFSLNFSGNKKGVKVGSYRPFQDNSH